MEFEIDVSGEDIFNRDYAICIADRNNIVRGYKFDEKTIQILRSRHGKGVYRYGLSHQEKAYLKIRIYSVIIYYLFKDILDKISNKEVNIKICKDFQGHEKDITSNLLYLLRDKLRLKISIRYSRLSDDSPAHKYALIMRQDKLDKMQGYVKINLEEIEKFLRK